MISMGNYAVHDTIAREALSFKALVSGPWCISERRTRAFGAVLKEWKMLRGHRQVCRVIYLCRLFDLDTNF